MTTQLLFYETAVPVNAGRHKDWCVKAGSDYAFSRHVNSVPLMAIEFARAASEYPIVFAGGDTAVMPAVILGMRGSENLYLGEDGHWDAKYIPAFVRRYPFVFSSSDDGKTFTLCIDEAFAGCNQEGQGERLFDDSNQATPYVRNVLQFLQGYQSEFQRTQAFCQKLKDLNLLEPMQAQMSLTGGGHVSLTGFMGVNRDKLKALTDDTLAALAKSDELEWLYLHLHSLQNFESMRNRLATTTDESAADESKGKKGNGA